MIQFNIIFIILCLFSLHLSAQNLIKNGDFEEANGDFAASWSVATGSPDYLYFLKDNLSKGDATDSLPNISLANSGFMRNAITYFGSEAFYQALEQKLIRGRYYETFCDVYAGHNCQIGFEEVTIALTTKPIEFTSRWDSFEVNCLKLTNPLKYISPGKWHTVKTIFIASGHEKFITVANFNSANTKYTPTVKETQEIGWKNGCHFIVYDNFNLREIEKPIPKKKEKKIILNDVFFNSSVSSLSDRTKTDLDSISAIVMNHTGTIAIIGHTDNQGTTESNRKLSLERANSVKKYLISKGIDSTFISTEGRYDSQPIASNLTDGGRSKNRRVEIILKY